MITLQEIIDELMKIREASNAIEVKGNQNAALLCFIYGHSDVLINELNAAIEKIQNESKPESDDNNVVIEAGEEIGENNTESA